MNLALCSLPPLDLAPPSLGAVNSCLVVENGKRCRFGRQEAAAVGGRKVVVACHVMPGPYLEGSFKRPGGGRKLQFVRTLLIDNYDSYTYNIYQELSVVNRVPPVVVRNDEWTWEELKRYLSEEKAFDNIVISPGPGSPTCPSDIGICLQLLLECKDIPILGVCMGHQALGYVHGAQIVHASEPVHGRLSEIEHNGCRLFHGIPSGPNSGFNVVRYHSLILDADSLPKELIPIAWTSSTGTHSFLEMRNCELFLNGCKSGMEPTVSFHTNAPKPYNVTSWSFSDLGKMPRGGLLMGIMHSSRPHYGLQFHPESIATCHGRQIFHNFREFTEDYWQRLRLKFSCQTDALYDACMQVPGTSQLFRVPINMPDVFDKDIGSFRESSMKCQFLSNGVENNFFSMPQILDLSELGIGLKHVRLKWRKLDQLAAKVGGSKNIFHKLFGTSKAKNTFWLDSSSLEKERARFSFMGGKCGPLWRQLTFRLSDESDSGFKGGGYLFTEDAQGATRRMLLENGFLDFLNKELQSFCYDAKDFEGLPFEFYGGYIGYIGYNLKVECGASNRHMSRTPDACFFFVDNFLVIDHRYDDVYIMSVHEANTTISSWLDDTEERLRSLEPSFERKLEPAKSFPSKAAFVGEKTREQYVSDVQNCLNYIKDGESYELCLTTQLKRSVGEIDSLGLYLLLREKNPAPYAAWMNFSSEHLCICCSSPERFLRLDRSGMLEAKPIKGTVARGATKEEDEQLKLQLQYSEKDQAENLMIVDLLRNDLGRVCKPGSVHVPLLMDVESYATVHTMVSTIRGRKKSRATAVDCIRAAFPGGSMTGAPKLRSMELLDSLESCSRGIYSGSIGFFSFNQTFDLNIVIRTVVIHEGEASIGAGGAIVALSNPEDEYEEMLLKTRAPAKAVIESL